MARTIKVGIIGANARGGWAAESHVPAVKGLPGLELAAVATNSQDTADEAAKAFGVAKAYPSGSDLIRDAEIDLVTVATRVPDHKDLVLAAIAAGKHVYCEWPLGRSSAEAEEMAQSAQTAGVHTAIGLQLRGSPAVRRAQEQIASGDIGRVLSVSGYSSVAGFGPKVPSQFAYLEDPASFANLVTIQGAHTIDLATALAGDLSSIAALLTAQYPEIEIGDDHEVQRRTTFDHLLAQGTLSAGGTLAVEVAGARPPETPAWIEVVGEQGVLRLQGGAARGIQSSLLTLSQNGNVEPEHGERPADLPDTAINVAGIYTALLQDILSGSRTVAGFNHALRLTTVIEQAFESSRTGRRLDVLPS